MYPFPEKKKVVRGELIIGGWLIEKLEEKLSRATYVSCSDLKGNVPQTLINMVMKEEGAIAGVLREKMNEAGMATKGK